MSTHEPDPVYVRASVSGRCNLTCVYCPKQEGMENRVPALLKGRVLQPSDYCNNLSHLARNGVRGICFTGGEPTLNPSLPILVAHAAHEFDRVELTTNGRFLEEMLPQLAPHLDLLKVSFDVADRQLSRSLTAGTARDYDRALNAIRLGCAAGLPVGVNVVVMKSTMQQVDQVVSVVRLLNREGHTGRAYVSLLDFYYSAERRDFWEREFVPIDGLAAEFARRFGPSVSHERFGCRFFWFDAEGVQVRFKDSFGSTHRAPKCTGCKYYCQEGVYGLKHSAEGWVTTCPTGDDSYGVHLSPGLSPDEVDRRLGSLLGDVAAAKPSNDTFRTMLTTHDLRPEAVTPRTSSPAAHSVER